MEGSEVLCNNLQLSYQSTQYNLVQIHFHTPSEHTFGGGYYDAEAHLVHQNPLNTKQYLVLGVMLQASAVKISKFQQFIFK